MAAIDRNVGKKFQKSYFDVLGLCCSSEIPMIEKILNSLDGVKDFSVVVPTKTVIVVHDSLLISQIQIVKALNQARLEANIRAYGETNYKNKWPNPYAVISGVLLLLSFLKYFYSPLRWLALGAVAVGIVPILLKAVSSLRNFTLDINILVLIAVAGSVALHDYWEAGTIVFLFTIAEWLESRASYKATAVMSSLVSVVPQRAVLADTGEEINADEVKLNTIVAVKAGEVIPIDGIVVQGNCEVDEKFLTGESFPVAKQKDSIVWASTINLNGYITVKTTKVAEDCMVARMAKLVEDAQNKKSRTQRFMDKCAKYYTPAIVMISACLAIVPLVFEVHNKKEWYHLSLVVLVSGCPCALLLSTPVAMFCALSKAAKLGVLFKGAEHLETLARVKTMAFDKTGTITRGEFLVADFKPLEANISLNTLLYWTSSIESESSHPMAAALVDFARANEIEPKPEKVEKFQIFPGEGIYGRIEDNEIYVGNWKLAARAGCAEVPKLEGYDVEGKSVGFVFLGSSPVAVFSLSDVFRTGAKEALKELKSKGIKTVMLTGDCHAAANQAQAQLGGAIDIVHAELLPDDKGRLIKELQKGGPTAMIGDGVNDAPALATADVGISMGVSGSALATETGDIVLMSNDIRRIPKALQIAKQVRRKIIENVVISISSKAAILGLAIGGHPLVWAAVLADVGTCLLVIFNSMLILRGIASTTTSHHIHKHAACGGKSSSCSDIESQNYKKCGSVGCCQNEKKCCSSPAKEHSCNGTPSTTASEHVHKHESCGGKSSACFDIESQSKKCSSTDPTACENKKKCCLSPAKEHSCDGNHQHHHRHVENGISGKENTAKEQGNDGNHHHHHHVENGSCGKENTAKEKGNDGNHRHHHHHRHVENGNCDRENTAKEQGNDGNHHHHHHRHVENGSCGKENTAKEHGNEGNHHHHTHPHDEIVNCGEKPATNEHNSGGHHHHHPHVNNDASCVKKSNCNVTEDGVHFHETTQKHKCCKQSTSPTVVDMPDTKACKGSNGCCESFRRECCVRNGHEGISFAGGLSEIVIE